MGAKRKSIRLNHHQRTKSRTFIHPLGGQNFPAPEEIAQAIWYRQHSALSPDAINYRAKWRDHSIPSKYWDEYLLDAEAVLTLLRQQRRELR